MNSRNLNKLIFSSAALVAVITLIVLNSSPILAQLNTEIDEMKGVEVTERLDEQLPLDLSFRDEDGNFVKLRDFFHNDRPVLLTLNYYNCPMLCGLLLNGMTDGLKELNWSPGVEYDIVTVSIDPRETPDLAKVKKENYLKFFDREGAGDGWHFLVGDQRSITRLTEALGYGYRYLPDQDEFSHPSVLMMITPDGRISRYIYGIQFEPRTLQLALFEASEGKIGNTIERFILSCFMYNPNDGQYTLAIMRIMRIGGGVTVVFVLLMVSFLYYRERLRIREAFATSTPQPAA